MFRRISRKLAKELLDSGLVYHDRRPYNTVRFGKDHWTYVKENTAPNWPRVADWDSTTHSEYRHFLRLEE